MSANPLLETMELADIPLWTSSDVATYLGISLNYFNNRIRRVSDFPPQVRQGKKWRSDEVIKWNLREA